jgi:hypothetical protein
MSHGQRKNAMSKNAQRWAADLIRELEANAGKFSFLRLAAINLRNMDNRSGSENESIGSRDGTADEKLRKLNALMEAGFLPIGFLGTVIDANGPRPRIAVYESLLDHHAGGPAAPWFREYLDGLAENFCAALRDDFGAP